MDARLARVGALEEPTRRALYLYVTSQAHAVGRDEAAAGVGVSRSLATFHLDRLAEEGLLDVEYRRLGGRTGPGAGRPSKLYRRSDRQIDITLPPRRYELVAEVLADALERADAVGVQQAVGDAARNRGVLMARSTADRLGGRASRRRRLEALHELMAAHAFEPYRDDNGELRVRNCPFHALADAHPDLVCGMTSALGQGVADTLALDVSIRLDPKPGECCIVFGARSRGRAADARGRPGRGPRAEDS